MIRLILMLFLLCTPASNLILAQERAPETEFYEWFDNLIGLENTAIFNGVEYTEKHVMINEKHKFLLTSLFKPGTIYYEGQTFNNVNMKYNVFEDVIVVRLPKKSGGEETFMLHPERVQGFEIDGHKFLNFAFNNQESEVEGFHEIIYEAGEIKLLKDHVRRIFLRRDGSYPYHEFNDPGANYAVYLNGDYTPVRNRREVMRAFPEFEDIIKGYYKDNNKLQKSDPDGFLTGLFEIMGSRLNSKIQ